MPAKLTLKAAVVADAINDCPLVQNHKDNVMLQAFSWGSSREQWFKKLAQKSEDIKISGVDLVWLPPCHESLAPQGYMPKDYFNFNSAYGSEQDLRNVVQELHNQGLTVLADVVLNHRCANKQDKNGQWNVFECSKNVMNWDASHLVKDSYGGTGNPKNQELTPFEAAPNIDHSNEKVQQDVVTYLKFLREDMKFDGFRLDFTKGYQGEVVGRYMKESNPEFAVGEFWDALDYDGNRPRTYQMCHRSRLVDWVQKTEMRACAFDFTTKGQLQEALRWSKFKDTGLFQMKILKWVMLTYQATQVSPAFFGIT